MEPREPSRLPYLAPLDGVRAVAILAVLLFHVWPAALRGGFMGVDVFFVLSGFLITSLILPEIRDGRFSFGEFYRRRIQRLLPNAILTILAVLLLWSQFMPPGAVVQPAVHGLWTLFNLANVYAWRHLGGYWGNAAEWAPLTHFWSLGIEEQFYLFFPGAIVLLARVQPERIRSWLIFAAGLSFGLCVYGTYTRPTATFYLLPTRFWELLLGAILAARHPSIRIPAVPREATGWLGLGLILAGFLIVGDESAFPGFAVLLPTLGTVLVLSSVAEGETRIAKLLSVPFMRRTGKLSYSLYLWHWPLIIFGKSQAISHGLPPLAGAVAGGFAGVVLAWVAYALVERPLRQRGPGRSRRLLTIAAAFSAAAVGCGLVATRPVVYDPDHHFARPQFLGKLFDAGRAANSRELTTTVRYADTYFPSVSAATTDAWRRGGIVHRFGGDRPQVVVLGSSHALMYARLIDDLCREKGLSVAFLCVDEGTPAFFETSLNSNFTSAAEAREFDEARKKWLQVWRPETVFVIDRWDAWVGKSPGFDVKLRQFLHEVSPSAGRILFVSQIPALNVGGDVNLRGLVSWRLRLEQKLPRLEPDAKEDLRREAVTAAEAAIADFPNLRVLRADRLFYQEDGAVRYADGRDFLYADNNHLTDAGSERVRELFRAAIAEAPSRP